MFTLKEILVATRGRIVQQGKERNIKRISTDTRSIKRGDLFVAIKGPTFDAHDFLQQAVEKGAGVLLIQRLDISLPAGIVVIFVPDTLKAYGQIALFHRRRFPHLNVIAITGSAGKTTTKEMIASVLKRKYRVHYTKGTFNNHIGVPLTLLNIRSTHQVAIIEAGTNHHGEIKYLASLIEPTIAVFTNIGPSHLEGLGSLKGVYQEKSALAKSLNDDGVIIFNQDDVFLKQFQKWAKPQQRISYGIKDDADVQALEVKANVKGISFNIKKELFVLRTPVIGNLYNALAAIAVGQLLSVRKEEIKKALRLFKSPKGRHVFYKIKNITLIDDTYNANPLSFKNAIQTLQILSHQRGRSFLIASDMLELGPSSLQLHHDIGAFSADSGIDQVLTYGMMAKHIAQGVIDAKKRTQAIFFESKEALFDYLKKQLRPHDVVLVKGSRGTHMEDVVQQFISFLKG